MAARSSGRRKIWRLVCRCPILHGIAPASSVTYHTLPPDVVAVWQLTLDDYAPIESLLSSDERERAARFVHKRDSRRFLVCRTLLRQILAHHLDSDPQQIFFSYNACGKPELINHVISFNVSHAEDEALIAVSPGRRVGIDIERLAPRRAARIKRILTQAHDTEMPNDMREIILQWTRVEAIIKARGDGLSFPLPDAQRLAEGFAVRSVDVGPHFVASVAADGAPWKMVKQTNPAVSL